MLKFNHILAVTEVRSQYFVKVLTAGSSVYPQHKQDPEKNQEELSQVSIYLPRSFLYRTLVAVQLSSLTQTSQK